MNFNLIKKTFSVVTGTFCGHSVLLSHPYTPEGVSVGQLGYEGDFLLLRDSKIQQQTEDLEQEENKIQAVRHLLPLSDPIFKVFDKNSLTFTYIAILFNKYNIKGTMRV